MSALSTFMEALHQASKETPPESYALHQGHRNHEKLVDTIPGSFTTHNGLAQDHISEGNGDIRPSAAMAQGANRDAHATEGQQQTTSHAISVVEPVTRPPLPVRSSLDDLFSDVESDQDGGEELHMKEGARTYDPNAPTQFYEELDAQQEFGSPQISPDHPFYPHQQPWPRKVQTKDQHLEAQTVLSEDDQIAQFSEKAFRNIIRQTEPGLSKEQQYYAWRIAYQNAYGEQADGVVDHEGFEGRAQILDQNPPYQLGMEAVGCMNDVPLYTHANGNHALDEIEGRIDQSLSRGHDSAEATRQEEEPGEQLDDTHAVSEGVRPSNPFSPHHDIPSPTAPRTDRAAREKMLESSFSKAIQALDKDTAERIAREGEVDEAHLRRLRKLSHRRSWAFDDGHLDNQDDEEPPESSTTARGRQDSPSPSATVIKIGTGRGNSPSKINPDDSFTTALESPEKQRSDGETMRSIQAKMAEHHRQLYARHHDQADDEESTASPSRQIPGLYHLNPPSPLMRGDASTPSQLFTPPSPKSSSPDRDIRKSIEPETPRHLLNRECTPAFEDRSCTPSPRTIIADDGDEDADLFMIDASSPSSPSSQHQKDAGNAGTPAQPTISGMPNSRPHHPEPSQQQQQQSQPPENQPPQPQTPPTLTHRAGSASPPKQPSIPIPTTTITSTPTGKASKASKARPKPRRKSAVQGSGIKIEKPKPAKSTPKSRSVTTTTTITSSPVRKMTLAKKDLATGIKVKEAVERIEASVRETGEKKMKSKTKMEKGTPPARRSRRLIEKGERAGTATPEPEMELERERERRLG
ncbi:hypothetical protein EPUS_05682 [Endocarpon pusillum Z07020]|uniref:Uncharacterized protein n=1 Tax=Endocarpon pusillum (strain Z07020 / HMAS-L-300199) TaxID=1263415 RepID=U1GKD4_ENDPU|nr:uncharacterized protein EPUS_05682 [Endocarpon pusillum Z07020]ERF72628.1 hypothetical protein EPUS_05682 [Endocarpon pusillum Z07020]